MAFHLEGLWLFAGSDFGIQARLCVVEACVAAVHGERSLPLTAPLETAYALTSDEIVEA